LLVQGFASHGLLPEAALDFKCSKNICSINFSREPVLALAERDYIGERMPEALAGIP
jgi:hypothetical protein